LERIDIGWMSAWADAQRLMDCRRPSCAGVDQRPFEPGHRVGGTLVDMDRDDAN
jgi:hypothetical protein